MNKTAPYQLLHNSRFYIVMFSVLLSVAVFAWLRMTIDSNQLLAIRTQQFYGFICIMFWYIALIISPLGYVIGKHRMRHIEYSRRAIGVSAFYFALLHACIAVFGQLGGIDQIQYLPDLFKWSLMGGVIALCVLGLMAITSFDGVIKFMTYRKWKWLHRFVYAAGVLAILHIWMIGTHLAYSGVQLASFAALILLLGLQLFKSTKLANRKFLHLGKVEAGTVFLTVWAIASIALAAMPAFIDNYHSRHTEHDSHQESE